MHRRSRSEFPLLPLVCWHCPTWTACLPPHLAMRTRVNPSRSPGPGRRECGGGHLASLAGSRDPGGRGAAGRIWAPGTSVRAAEPIWDRSHVVRLHLATDRSVVMKKQADKDSFGVELATLEYLNGMPRTRRPAAAGRRRRHLAVVTNHMIARRLSHAELRTLQTGNDCGPEVGSISQA